MYFNMYTNVNYLYVVYLNLHVYVGMLVVKKGNLTGISFIALLYWSMVLSKALNVTLKLCYVFKGINSFVT